MKTATKMYLSVILSTLCIMFYQYQLSKANFVTTQRNGGNNAVISDSGIVNGNAPSVRMPLAYGISFDHYHYIVSILSFI